MHGEKLPPGLEIALTVGGSNTRLRKIVLDALTEHGLMAMTLSVSAVKEDEKVMRTAVSFTPAVARRVMEACVPNDNDHAYEVAFDTLRI